MSAAQLRVPPHDCCHVTRCSGPARREWGGGRHRPLLRRLLQPLRRPGGAPSVRTCCSSSSLPLPRSSWALILAAAWTCRAGQRCGPGRGAPAARAGCWPGRAGWRPPASTPRWAAPPAPPPHAPIVLATSTTAKPRAKRALRGGRARLAAAQHAAANLQPGQGCMGRPGAELTLIRLATCNPAALACPQHLPSTVLPVGPSGSGTAVARKMAELGGKGAFQGKSHAAEQAARLCRPPPLAAAACGGGALLGWALRRECITQSLDP